MERWLYIERKTTKVFFWAIFVCGELFLIAILLFIFNQGAANISPLAIPASLIALFLWSGIFQYFFSNSPKSITVSSEGLLVTYSKKREQLYAWEHVSLKNIGLNPIPFIFIKNIETSVLLKIPRIVFLDGSSKGYKELIKRIKMKGV
jgi:hypothetical protein